MNKPVFYEKTRPFFGPYKAQQVFGMDLLLDMMVADKPTRISDPRIQDVNLWAYMLATAWVETAYTMMPIKERGSVEYFEARYDAFKGSTPARRARAKKMGNIHPGDGAKFPGRGYVQTTWYRNYLRLGKEVHLDLITNPDLAMRPDVAYAALSSGLLKGWFTGKCLLDYSCSPAPDFEGMRACVNGTDRAKEISGYATRFASALRASSF